MLIAAIVGRDGINETASLVNSILSTTDQKVSIVDIRNLSGLGAKRVKSYISELSKNSVDILILKIGCNEACDEVLSNIVFDIIICTDKTDGFDDNSKAQFPNPIKRALSMLDEKGLVIVNADDSTLMEFLTGLSRPIVTYGFNPRASITTSSVGDTFFEGKFMCSLQKTICAKNGLTLEPQEYIVKVDSHDTDSYNVLAAATFAIVNGIDLNHIGHH